MQVVHGRCCGLDIHKKRHVWVQTATAMKMGHTAIQRGWGTDVDRTPVSNESVQEADGGRVQQSRSVAIPVAG
jgi:hypothetical protein